ncbi:protein JTB [Discoglossus pictus]
MCRGYCSRRAVMVTAAWLLAALLVLGWERLAESALPEQKIPDSPSQITPCWVVEEYVISKECSACLTFQHKTTSECGITGFVEQVNCSTSKKAEYKRCRSTVREKQLFWEFVGCMIAAALVLALVVVCRQRTLDRRALEKVRKQIESI